MSPPLTTRMVAAWAARTGAQRKCEAAVDIGQIGIWTFQFDQQPWAAVAEAAAELEELGYGALWFPEFRGREAYAQAALLLGATRRIAVVPGIANIYAR